MMQRHELLDKIEEITDSNYRSFVGINEAELHTREDIADLIEQCKKDEAIRFLNFYYENTALIPTAVNHAYEKFKEATK